LGLRPLGFETSATGILFDALVVGCDDRRKRTFLEAFSKISEATAESFKFALIPMSIVLVLEVTVVDKPSVVLVVTVAVTVVLLSGVSGSKLSNSRRHGFRK